MEAAPSTARHASWQTVRGEAIDIQDSDPVFAGGHGSSSARFDFKSTLYGGPAADSSEAHGASTVSYTQQHTLTDHEVKLFNAFRNSYDPTIYELGAVTRLTPSEVLHALSGLIGKNLVVRTTGGKLVGLTAEGRRVLRFLKKGRVPRQYQISNWVEDLDSEGLDRAIEVRLANRHK